MATLMMTFMLLMTTKNIYLISIQILSRKDKEKTKIIRTLKEPMIRNCGKQLGNDDKRVMSK